MKIALVISAAALLSAGTAFAHPHPNADTQAGKPSKVVCKRVVETGSLAKVGRTCKTREAWQREGEAARRDVQQMQDASLINSARPN